MNIPRGCENAKWAIVAILVLFIAVAVFGLHPAVKIGRNPVPDVVHVGALCDCHCIKERRPWYSKFNYWFWLWVVIVPIIVFSVGPEASKRIRAFRTILSIGLGYILVILSVFLAMKIDVSPTVVSSGDLLQYRDSYSDCFSVGGGAKIAFAIMFGWGYGAVYTGCWDMAWYRYHVWGKKEAGINMERDIISHLAAKLSFFVLLIVIVGILFVSIVALMGEHT